MGVINNLVIAMQLTMDTILLLYCMAMDNTRQNAFLISCSLCYGDKPQLFSAHG